jgi:hypothetical protein
MNSAVILQFALAIFQLRETGSSNMTFEGVFRGTRVPQPEDYDSLAAGTDSDSAQLA